MSVSWAIDPHCLDWFGCGLGSHIGAPLRDNAVNIGTDGSNCKRLQQHASQIFRLPYRGGGITSPTSKSSVYQAQSQTSFGVTFENTNRWYYNGDVPFVALKDLGFVEYICVRNFQNFVNRGVIYENTTLLKVVF
ncbi:hypothetical protein MTO96_046345 [Rhipicephalus appendiculatus]